MRVSVVMATYNGKDYLYEQLDSLRCQTLQADEVLFFDDGSKDGTVSMLKAYIQKYGLEKSWHITVNEKNLGYADNFHKALQAAKGEYIFFSDQDDIWLENKLEETVGILDKHPEIKLLCTDYAPFSSAAEAPRVPAKIRRRMKNDGSLEKIELSSKNIHIASLGCVMCIPSSFRDEIESYWQKGWAHDDYVWKLAQCADGCYMYHRALIRRRLHDHNVSMQKMHDFSRRVRFFDELLISHTQMYRYGKDKGFSEDRLHLIERFLKADRLRKELVEEGKLGNSLKLLPYLDCYHSRKSVLMEPYIALKHRKQCRA